MKKLFILIFMLFHIVYSVGQQKDSFLNSADNMLGKDSKLTIGGYGQIDYNQPIDGGSNNGTLDVHRLVLLFSYKFTDRLSLVSEIEFEHVKEVFVEQAFVDYRIGRQFSLRGGLLLIPMGIINLYHEPTTFLGVERPEVDNRIVPTTWREIGIGFSGRVDGLSLRYQAYIMNGFVSYSNGSGRLFGSTGLRQGRQRGAESIFKNPNLSAKVDYYGILGLKLGLAGYIGKTQSELYDDESLTSSQIDSTVVGVSMIGLDARYEQGSILARGQFIYSSLSNTDQYNIKAERDLGSSLLGWYLELGYDFLPLLGYSLKSEQERKQLILFSRYENHDTHNGVSGMLETNNEYNQSDWLIGLNYRIGNGVAFKIDYKLNSSKVKGSNKSILNAGIGFWF